MPTSALIPDDRRRIADLERRVGILERALRSTGAPIVDELVFSYAGALVDGTESAPKIIRVSGVLSVLAVAFKPTSAGSTDTVLDVLRNGTVAVTVTIPASTTEFVVPVAVAYSAGDTVALVVNNAGTGAADMTAAARLI
jgi:hypothetical protein